MPRADMRMGEVHQVSYFCNAVNEARTYATPGRLYVSGSRLFADVLVCPRCGGSHAVVCEGVTVGPPAP
jgi:hypothetical protein